MEQTEPRRRGRPPIEQAPDMPETPPKRRRRAKLGVHALKLQAPLRQGYTRRWVNDTQMRVAEMESLGYEFVHEPDTKSTDVGSRVSRLVGNQANGDAQRAYLMETPDELYAEGLAEKEAASAVVDEAIATGAPTDSTGAQQLVRGEGSIKRDR